jgi:polar amino acid transport system substrate-binding protein
MKKFLLTLLVFIMVISVTSQKLIIAVNNAPPYRIIENGNFSGIYIDTVKLLLESLNIEYEFIEVPFARALILMESGEADLMLGPNKNAEREAYMKFLIEAPLPRENRIFYVKNEKNFINKYEDLYSKTIDVLRGAVYFEKFDNDTNLTKEIVNSYDLGIRKVDNARTDVIIMPEMMGDFLLRTLNIQLLKSPYIVEGNISYIAISKKSKFIGYSQIFSETLSEILNTQFETILKNYR